MEQKVTELVINRPNWLRGEGAGDSFLLRESDNRMCCLGFYSRACGFSKDSLVGQRGPMQLGTNIIPDQMKWLYIGKGNSEHSGVANKAMTVNDGSQEYVELSEEERERKLTELFAEHGIKVTFTDEPMEATR